MNFNTFPKLSEKRSCSERERTLAECAVTSCQPVFGEDTWIYTSFTQRYNSTTAINKMCAYASCDHRLRKSVRDITEIWQVKATLFQGNIDNSNIDATL